MDKRQAIGGAALILAALAFSQRAGAATRPQRNDEAWEFSPDNWGTYPDDFGTTNAAYVAPDAPDAIYQGEIYPEDFAMNADVFGASAAPSEYVGDLPPEDYELTPEAAAAPEVAKDGPGLFSMLVSTGGGDVFDALGNQNVQAFLAMIREFESRGNYNVVYGFKPFEDLSDHPRIAKLSPWGWTSAAGAYQIMARSPIPGTDRWTRIDTWGEVKKKLNLPDFSPESQDAAAVFLIKRRGALPSVLRGDFDTAINKVRKEWASLPGAGYGQPEKSLQAARDVYAANGGSFETV